MGRKTGGWRIKLPAGRKTYIVRFTHNGKTRDLSTGCEDPEAASGEAARIYADHIQRDPPKRVVTQRDDVPALLTLLTTWLDTDTTMDPDTASTWTTYATHYCEFFKPSPTADAQLHGVTEASATNYRNHRLSRVLATTVRKEMSTLRRFLAWCTLNGYLQRAVHVPGVPTKATGTRHTQRRRVAAPELSPEEIATFLAALPEWSTSRKVEPFPIRARFIFGYETGLRPEAISLIEVPRHWQPGATTLRITADLDKNRWERDVPLTQAAIVALTVAAPDSGPIFGHHDYREHVAAAAKLAMPAHKADIFTGTHLRSAITTHELEATGNLVGVQFLRGHKQASTTARYARAGSRAASVVHAARPAMVLPASPVVEAAAAPSPIKRPRKKASGDANRISGTVSAESVSFLSCEGEDLNLHGSYPASTSTQRDRKKDRQKRE